MSIFRPNPDLAAELLADPDARHDMVEVIEESVVPAVQAVAPTSSGTYASSIAAYEDEETVGVTAFDFAAHLIEWGSAKNPAYAPLRRGVEAAGLRLQEDPK